MIRNIVLIFIILISSESYAEDNFDIKFGYLSVDPETKEAWVIEETTRIKYASVLPWGFTVKPKIKGTTFKIETKSIGTCDIEEDGGPYTVWGYYEIYEWDTESKPCTRTVSVIINGKLIKKIQYEIENTEI